MHTGAGACIFKHKKLEKDDLLLLIETQIRSDRQISNGRLRHNGIVML